jgi:DNA polymerase
MHRLHIDFETRSKCDLQTHGAWLYAKHPSTEINCLGYAYDNNPATVIKKDWVNKIDYELLKYVRDKSVTIHAYNVFFEFVIWEHIMVPIGYPKIPIERWRCTMAKALAFGLPSGLSDAGRILGVDIQKDILGRSIMLSLCKPIENSYTPQGTPLFQLNQYEYDEDPVKFEKLYSYCKNDVESERAIDRRIPDLSETEQAVWEETMRINLNGICCDKKLIESVTSMYGSAEQEATARLSKITFGAVTSIGQRDRMIDWLATKGVTINKLRKGDVEELLDDSENLPTGAREVLDIRKSFGRSSVTKYFAMRDMLDVDDHIRGLLVYHGAHTGRWTSKDVQLQNFARGAKNNAVLVDTLKTGEIEFVRYMYGDPIRAMSDALRGSLVASPGRALYVADYAAIECRTIAWLAGDQEALNVFRSFDRGAGTEPYIVMARRIFEDDSITDKDEDKRQVGKMAELGCCYGMGYTTFLRTCEQYNIKISEQTAKKTIIAYRELHKPIVSFWYEIEKACRTVLEKNVRIPIGKVFVTGRKGLVQIQLPSGRFLNYHQPRIDVTSTCEQLVYYRVDPKTKRWSEHRTWGGEITENINQGIARDIMANGMLTASKNGYTNLSMSHDEAITESEPGRPASHLCSLLCTKPDWAQDLPLVAKGWSGERYRK